jgi:carbon storage regulator
MLVLSRRQSESVVIRDDIVVTVVKIRGNQVHLAFDAPRDTPIHRREVYDAIRRDLADRPELVSADAS